MDALYTKKQEFRSLLPNKGIQPTIDSLRKFLLEDSEKFTTLILIESHFKEVRKLQQQGVISLDSLLLEESKTRKNLLDFILDLEEVDYPLIDARDGQKYKKVRLLGNVWMAENLNFDVGEGCWFYDNDPKNGEKYGWLYTWEAAKKACPPGWRLPTDEEWEALAQSAGGYYDTSTKKEIGDPKKGYQALLEGGSSGLAAQLGGGRNSYGDFYNLGGWGSYWSATEWIASGAWSYDFLRNDGKLYRYGSRKTVGRSCRCVQGS